MYCENVSGLHQASYEQIGADPVLCFHLNLLQLHLQLPAMSLSEMR